ncbi:MAG: tRNA (adenine(22)-N(1))-methyltransferase TrmK, partial [Gammaproteobacteria bacterium]|nr:tRNA (adenine(22)-N(1))-methyltransferase TrmK [Gammaproteobacteria bacterium]
MLAVMKAGAAYVPLDPSLPKQRISQIAGQCGLSVVIQSAAHQQTLPIEVAHLINADDVEAYGPSDNPDQRVEPEHLCYVMFTSGSTGTPKGVMVTHGNLEPLYQDIGPHLDISADDVWSLFHPFSFGFSIWEIWGALSHGGRLVIISPELRTDPSAFFELIKVEAVTIVSQTPSAFRQNMLDSAFDQDLSATALRLIVLSGEAVDSQAVATWIERHGDTEPRLVNTYAITETAGQVTCASLSRELISKDQSKNVGLPLKHVEVLLLDDEGQPVQRGNPGELCVGGPSVAVGYIGELELTAQQFINRSFAGCESTRWYKTGDRARLTVKGEIEFLGRRDDQIKLRGYRIELGEIETALRAHPQVRDAAVALKPTSAGSRRLVGYAVPNAAEDHSSRPQFWPSVGPYQVYDEFLYDLMSAEAERLERYRQAFAGTVAGKVVLDIGTGEHALLARMCVDEGARRVYAVEVLEEAFVKAKAFVKAQGLEQQIIVLQGDIANIDLPERVDVCTQGIIGNIGSADGIVPIWNSARHHFQPDCIPVPARCRTMIAAVELPQSLLKQPAFSSLASGYAWQVFEKMGRHFDIRLCVSDFPEEAVISAPHEFEDLNFTTHLAEQSAGSATFKIDRDARLDGYLVWTVVTTAGDEDVDYRRNQRAWLPVFFPLGETGDAWGEAVESGQEIQVSWSSQMTTGIQPDYEVRTSINGHDYAYRSCYDEQALNGTPVHRALWGSLPAAATSLSPEALKEWLAARLPEYMVPSAWLMLDQLPMNANQKLDRAALPSPDDDAGSAPGTADLPNTPLEKDLLALWSEILGNDHMGVHDNFFDLGGDSIAAVRMTSALQRLLDDAVMLIAIFQAPSIASLAEFLQVHHRDAVTARYEESEQSTVVATQETSDGRADAPLSWQQQSFWVLSQLYPSMTGANEQFVITLDGALDIQRLEAAWNELLSRHDILHTVFLDHDDGVRQIVRPHESVALEVHDWTELDSEVSRDRLFMAAAEQAIVQDYDLANGPLLKADVFQLNARRSKLLVNAHHIIADGLSIRVIRDELAALYAQPNALPLPRMQYCDYALRQLADAHDGRWDRGIAYWRKTLAGAPDNVALPYRLSTLDTTDRFGYQRRAGFVIDATLAADVRALSRASGATLFMTLMAAFRVLLQRYSAQDDVLIGSPVTGREMGSTSDMIGCLVNN